jgi:hypothetical protein
VGRSFARVRFGSFSLSVVSCFTSIAPWPVPRRTYFQDGAQGVIKRGNAATRKTTTRPLAHAARWSGGHGSSTTWPYGSSTTWPYGSSTTGRAGGVAAGQTSLTSRSARGEPLVCAKAWRVLRLLRRAERRAPFRSPRALAALEPQCAIQVTTGSRRAACPRPRRRRALPASAAEASSAAEQRCRRHRQPARQRGRRHASGVRRRGGAAGAGTSRSSSQ